MNLKEILTKHNFPQEIVETLTKSGIKNLYPPQAEAINKGVLKGKNLVMSVPTAAGKTLIAELCMLNTIIHQNGRCLYIAPLKALTREKYEDFKKKYEPLGIKVGITTGEGSSTPSETLNRYQIIIATAEKVDSLLRSHATWLINSLNTVIIDEIHFINDGSRGPTLEILTARIKCLNEKIQILALSATINNAHQVAGWLDAELVLSDWRPIPLDEGVYFNEEINFNEKGIRLIKENIADDLSKLVIDTLRGKGQVLVFVGSRRSAQAASRQVCKAISKTLTFDEKIKLTDLAKKIHGGTADATKICQKLSDVVANGAAFHHAGLKPNQRKLIEDAFKENLIKVICSTPTLAAGVNLPARRVIVRDCKRFERGLGSAYIPTSEYKQCAGRAGRPQYDKIGEAILIAKSSSESDRLFEKYILAEPEPILSKLADPAALRIHILASIAGGFVYDINSMFEFFDKTFLSYQKLASNLIESISDIFNFLHEEGFIKKAGFRFESTDLGNLTSRLYIDPMSAITIRDGLKKIKDGKSFSNIGLLHLISCCPDSELLRNIAKSDYEKLESFANQCDDEFIYTQNDEKLFDDMYYYLSTLKTTLMLYQWTEEDKEDLICDSFNVGPGDIYRHIESAQWLLYTAEVIAKLFHWRNLTFVLGNLRKRVKYGIKEELLQLTKLKGIGRIRARNLFDQGFKKASELKHSSIEDIAKVPQISKALAKDLLIQVLQPPKFK